MRPLTLVLVALFLVATTAFQSPRTRTWIRRPQTTHEDSPIQGAFNRFDHRFQSPLSTRGNLEQIYVRLYLPSSSLHAAETNGAAGDDTSDPSGGAASSKNDNKQKRLANAYIAGQYAFGAAAALIFVMPDRTLTTLLASKLGGSAGFAMASGLCYILNGAVVHDRLASDTYKRLNVGLLGFCGLGLAAVPGEAAFMNSPGSAILSSIFLTAVKLYGTLLAVVGWKKGVFKKEEPLTTFAPKRMLQEFAQGTKETVKGLKVQNNKKALTYRNCLLLVGMGIVSSFMEGLFDIRYKKEFIRTWFEISLQWSAVARLFMISTMIYSLKDAAERDRLTGTTFIQMNVMVGFWASIVGLGQAIYPLGFAAYRGVEMFAFSFPFFLKAFKALKEKSEAKKSAP